MRVALLGLVLSTAALAETPDAGAPTPPDAGVVACRVDADCWFEWVEQKRVVVPRPKKLRHVKPKPCSSGFESTPVCRESVCTLVHWKC